MTLLNMLYPALSNFMKYEIEEGDRWREIEAKRLRYMKDHRYIEGDVNSIVVN